MPDPSSTTDDRYTRAHAEWEIRRANIARNLATVRMDGTTVAEALLVGGTWVWETFRPHINDGDRRWVGDLGTVVRDAHVQARKLLPDSARTEYAAHLREEPMPDCPGSEAVFDGEDAHAAGLTASSTHFCGECERSIPLAAGPEGLVVLPHDTKGRLLDAVA